MREFEAVADEPRGVRVAIAPIVGYEGVLEGGARGIAGAGCDAGEDVEDMRNDVGFKRTMVWISENTSVIRGY